MRIPFKYVLTDIQEIAYYTGRAFVLTLINYSSDESDSVDSDCDLDSDLSDFDPSTYGCGEITEAVEEMVETYSENCNPLEAIYGPEAEVLKETIRTATEETQCAGLKVFSELAPGEDRNLIGSCTAVCYWCCCETIKKVSPIIAEATTNLLI